MYWFQYIKKVEVPEFESIESFMGSRVHEVLELFYETLKKGDVLPIEYLSEQYNGLWEKKINPSVVVNKAGKTFGDYKLSGLKCIDDYYRRYKPFDSGEVVSTELLIEADLLGDGKYRIIGYIDRLDRHKAGHYEIHDYKTGGKLPDIRKKDFDSQLALYELGIRQMFRHEGDVELIWHYLVHDREIKLKKQAYELEEVKKNTVSMIDVVEKARRDDNFPAYRTGLCSWCAYQDLCAEMDKPKARLQSKLFKFF